MTMLGPDVVRSRILHALSERPLLATREIVESVGKVPFAYTSFYANSDCEICAPRSHYEYATPRLDWYSIRNDAGRLLAGLEREGLVARVGMHRLASWRLTDVAERSAARR